MPAADVSTLEAEHRILRTLRRKRGAVTAGDVAADSGLPLEQTSQVLRRMLSLYTSHLDVDDSGNLLYRFDPALRRRGDSAAWWWHRTRQTLWRAFRAFFKVWIMLMLIGYTAAFLLLLLALGVAALARGGSSSERRGGSFGMLPLYLLARVLETLFWIDLGSRLGGGMRPAHAAWGAPTRHTSAASRPRTHRTEKPVYQRIFQYVLGPEAAVDKLGAEKAFARFVRTRHGRITAAEWASRTGQSLKHADEALTGGVVRFNGTIDVAEDGTLVYRFDELRLSAKDRDPAAGAELPAIWTREPVVLALTGNPRSTNVWITVLNGFNLVMSIAVASGALALPLGLTIGLGYVPLVFSTLFFAVPLLRWWARKRELARVEHERQRRRALAEIFRAAEAAVPLDAVKLPATLSAQLLAEFEGEVKLHGGQAVYEFPRITEQLQRAREARAAGARTAGFGRVIFSSDPETLPLEQAELNDFDERLARELAGSAEFEAETPAAQPRHAWA